MFSIFSSKEKKLLDAAKNEKKLLDAARNDNTSEVERVLLKHPNVINCVDEVGRISNVYIE